MTSEEMQHAIEFLLEHHSRLSGRMDVNSEQIAEHSKQIAELTQAVSTLTQDVRTMGEAMQDGFDRMREEIQDALNKLILANEVTRKLSEDVARLGIQTSQRVTGLEQRVSDLEGKHE
jgi:uncharacterized protein YoxC